MKVKTKSSKQKLGLTSLEAKIRLAQYGENVVFKKKHLRPVVAFIRKFNSPLLLVLIATSIVSFFVGQKTNGVILLFMVMLSAILDFVNTYRSEKAVASLIAKVVTTATVWRDGKKKEILLKDIVPGDVIFLSAGDIIPADGRILESDDCFVNQSALTGESFPAEKEAVSEVTPEVITPEMKQIVFMGTSLVTGFATMEALHTGQKTEFGKIASQLQKTELDTDFDKNIRRFSLFIMRLTLLMVSFVFLVNVLAHRDLFTSFIFAIAIAVGLTPELLPVIISISLSRGSVRMAAKNVIVKHLPAIQNFGSMDVLCTDKTGTLTKDQIELVKYVDIHGQASDQLLTYAYANSFYHTGVQNPLDSAVKNYKKITLTAYKKIDEIPFDFLRRRQSVVVETGGQRLLISKGAPEEVLKVCSQYEDNGQVKSLSADVCRQVTQQFKDLSQQGFRVLGVASKKITTKAKTYSHDQEVDLVFQGFIAFLDPPKPTAEEAIKELAELGIEIKILTGDNELLTQKICRDLKLPIKGTYTGQQLLKMSDVQLQQAAMKATIFARVTPDQKERIITLLRKGGRVVGYLGDGINDAPALKAADIGISVNNAVDVAKESADIILLQKSLRVLKDGIIEGRRTFHNSMKYIMMGLSSNFGNMFSMMGASAFLPFLPMQPTQILLNNFIYDTSQLSLSSDSVDADDIRKPTAWNMKFIRLYMIVFGLVSSVFDFLTFGLLYLIFHLTESQFQTGWFIESIATQVFVIYVIRTRKIPFLQSRPSMLLLINTLLAVVIAWTLQFTPLGAYFGLQRLPFIILALIFFLVMVYLVLVQFTKQLFYRKFKLGMRRL
ncbi:MAG: magnesium-translocating P-type ATPase [Candidatus Komeilibacteria bacterium]